MPFVSVHKPAVFTGAPRVRLHDGVNHSRSAAGLALAAGQRSMQIGAAEYPHPPGTAFEVTGVDFLVDSAMRPWLLEFNAVPSMARQVIAALRHHLGT